mgnify:CR=1 FL=1
MQKINDFGEKIGGAKKDLWKERNMIFEDTIEMTEAEKRKYVKDQCRRNVRKRISEINRFLAERNASLYLS